MSFGKTGALVRLGAERYLGRAAQLNLRAPPGVTLGEDSIESARNMVRTHQTDAGRTA